MKFFTAEWATGELSDEEHEAAIPAYAKHLSSLSLPSDLQLLVDANLHDAVVEAVERRGKSLTLSLVAGDLQRGYSSANITYRGFEFSCGSEQLEWTEEAPEILYDEIARLHDRYVHRLLLSTYAHVEITFDSVVVSTAPRATRERTRAT
jgi:hypothetical protein